MFRFLYFLDYDEEDPEIILYLLKSFEMNQNLLFFVSVLQSDILPVVN